MPSVARRLLPGLGAAFVTAVLALAGALETMELGAYNRLFELRGPRAPRVPIVIVTIDEESFDELDLAWPFPRALHGDVLARIGAAGPLAIGVDILFPEPSTHGPADDAAFGAAVARTANVVLAATMTDSSEQVLGLALRKDDPNLPLPVIRAGAAAVASITLFPDEDGHIRRVPLAVAVGSESWPSFDVALARLAPTAGLPAAAALSGGDVRINFRGGPRTYGWIPYARVLRGDVPPEVFRGRIVLIGPTSSVLHDVFPTPFARAGDMPGVEIHANAIETLLSGDRVREVPRLLSVAVAALAAVLGGWLVVRLRAAWALLTAAAVAALLAGATMAGFAAGHVWVRSVVVLLGLGLGYGATVVLTFVDDQRARSRLSQFFSPAVLAEIVRHRDDGSLSSARRLVTVLFCDIRGFTSIAERLPPEAVVELLREYFTETTEVIFRHGGTVDKYLGDGVMALYNVPFEDPDHALQAVSTAVELQARTLALSARWEARLGAAIRSGIGINTGEAVVGTMGSRQRLEYTAIGDAVNLAARLEGLTKEHGAPIIISESTCARLDGRFGTRELGAVTVRGKDQPVKVYAVQT